MKIACLFPGQGSQFPGMGKTSFESSPEARRLMERANEVLGFRLTDIMFEGSADDLRQTRVTQPAIFLHSVALALTHPETVPSAVAGHSLGEFSALAVAGALEFEDALTLVSIRANAMQRCCEATPGSMAAVIGLADDIIADICAQVPGTVVPANFNCPGQVVISGQEAAVNEACERLKAAGARRALPLPVSGAFHSPLMEAAREELAHAIDAAPFKAPRCPVYQNVSASPQTDPEIIREQLLAQLTSPVRWTQTLRAFDADGFTDFVEIGPGNVLQGLVRRTLPEASVQGISE
ncbi:MAG: ACP S-malonyltransferase [Bacteroidales bacterium]|nr:ACP S-malonyltransferase [Bacteroidales bacterium]